MIAIDAKLMYENLSVVAARASDGDLEAFEALVSSVHGPLISYLHFLGVQDNQIDDLAQEVCIELYRSLRRYDSSREFMPWLYSIARNHTYNYWRKNRRTGEKLASYESMIREEIDAIFRDDRLVQNRFAKLEDCLDKVPKRQRSIVVLRYFEGLNATTIANRLEMSPDAVRQTLVRTRAALRKCMEEREEHGTDG